MRKIRQCNKKIADYLKGQYSEITNASCFSDVVKIKKLDSLLDSIKETRGVVNSIKKEKDYLIQQYILDTRPPTSLDINLLTYKALLMYFRNSFITRKIYLDFDKYEQNNELESEDLREFFPSKKTFIKVYLTNFPHLIGIKKDYFGSSNSIIEHILYEHELTDDFIRDATIMNTDLEKLETFSWIFSTLYNPTYILNKSGIIADNFQSDIVFIKNIFYPPKWDKEKKYYYHIVGLDYKEENEENFFIIKSQFPVKTKRNLEKKFNLKDKNSIIYIRSRSSR